MEKRDICKQCDACGGVGFETGTDPLSGDPIQTECAKCSGKGRILFGCINPDLVGDIESIKDKVDWLKKNVKEILKHLDIEEK